MDLKLPSENAHITLTLKALWWILGIAVSGAVWCTYVTFNIQALVSGQDAINKKLDRALSINSQPQNFSFRSTSSTIDP